MIDKLRKDVTKNDGSVADADLDADLANITPTIGQNLAILSKINEIHNTLQLLMNLSAPANHVLVTCCNHSVFASHHNLSPD